MLLMMLLINACGGDEKKADPLSNLGQDLAATEDCPASLSENPTDNCEILIPGPVSSQEIGKEMNKSSSGDRDLLRVRFPAAGIFTLWTQGETHTAIAYSGTEEAGRFKSINPQYVTITHLGVDEEGRNTTLSAAESGVRWLGDDNGILSINITNATLDHYFTVRVKTAGFYRLFLNFLVAAGATDTDSDGFGDGADTCPRNWNPAQRNTDGDTMGDACDSDDDNDMVLDDDEIPDCELLADCDDDGTQDNEDNCPIVANENQQNTDEADDGGDACDPDDDNDGINDDIPDNCPFIPNMDQLDNDTDEEGDACDDDDDNDGIKDDAPDNCQFVANAEQKNNDGDTMGDACDPDDDNDGINDDAPDNCPFIANADQLDNDMDNMGDVCDSDDDNDMVPDEAEAAGCQFFENCDGDAFNDGMDIDDDGDGLIELWNATMLHNVRYALTGIGYKESADAMIRNSSCGRQENDECKGYELTANISLAAYANADGGKGWLPLAHATEPSGLLCYNPTFAALLEGNNMTVSHVRIERGDESYIGLFGSLSFGARIRNLHLEVDSIRGKSQVGGLAGCMFGSSITNAYVVLDSINGSNQVGGLVGSHSIGSITNSYAISNSITGSDSIGGLVGSNSRGSITNAYAVSNAITGSDSIGGLVGSSTAGSITNAYAVSSSIRGNNQVGGLIGQGASAIINNSYAISSSIAGSSKVGGLAGFLSGDPRARSQIMNSYAVSNSIIGDELVGGLVGLVERQSGSGFLASISDSYWDSDTSDIGDLPSFPAGAPQTTNALRTPTSNSGIYENWRRGDEDECGWNFGTGSDYPALRCLPASPEMQRSFYSIEGGSVIIPPFQELLFSATRRSR